jgi:selenocysteine lyase/cysteine desulfurase
VLPRYANTHSETSGTGRQTTRFREDARALIRDAVGADRDEHAVLFCGSGSTAAIDRMVHVLGLRVPAALDDRYGWSRVVAGPRASRRLRRPVRAPLQRAAVARVDRRRRHHPRGRGRARRPRRARDGPARRRPPLRIGSFSAASNVTGILTDVRAVSALLHRHGALAFWDYAAAGPYVAIDVAASGEGPDGDVDHLDAVFLSPHKFVGGPGTPGVLVARRELFTNRVPAVPGGGTVAYVNAVEHRYHDDVEHREEGGTPDIVGSIRAGLAFAVKEAVGDGPDRRA